MSRKRGERLGTPHDRSSQIAGRRRAARLLVDVLFHYRRQGKFLLHEFVLMPDHFHVLLTPAETLERA